MLSPILSAKMNFYKLMREYERLKICLMTLCQVFSEIKIQQVVNQDEVCTQEIKDDKIDTVEDENNKQIKCYQSKPVEKKSGKRWEPVVAEKKSSRLAQDKRLA